MITMKVLIITYTFKSERWDDRIQGKVEETLHKLHYSGSNAELGEGLDKLDKLRSQENIKHHAPYAVTWIENVQAFEGEI